MKVTEILIQLLSLYHTKLYTMFQDNFLRFGNIALKSKREKCLKDAGPSIMPQFKE